MEPIKLLVVDDHELITLAIKQILSENPGVQLVGSAKCAHDAFEKIELLKPDVVLLDIFLPDQSGFEMMEKVLGVTPGVRFLIFSGSEKEDDIIQGFTMGASGYVLKSASPDELVDAIHSVFRDGHYSRGLVSKVLISSFTRKKPERDLSYNLSHREVEILKEIVAGKSNQEIADKLAISKRTVEAHKSNMMRRLHIKTTAELVLYGIKMKLINM